MNKKLIIFLGILLFNCKAQELRQVNLNIDEIIDDSIHDLVDEPNDSDDNLFDQISSDNPDKLQEILAQTYWHDHLPIWVKRFGIIVLMQIAEIREYCIKKWYRIKNSLNQ